MAPHPTSAAVFDLDDTLIDTKRVLLPAALARVAEAAGVAVADLDATGKRIDEILAPLPPLDAARRAAAARAWYDPAVPPLAPVPGAREVLTALQGKTRLFLLTRGDPERQRNKVAACGLGPCFEDVVIRPIEGGGSKRDDLAALLARTGLPPGRMAVVGDDPRDELRHAADLGCLAVHVPDTPLAEVPARLREAGFF